MKYPSFSVVVFLSLAFANLLAPIPSVYANLNEEEKSILASSYKDFILGYLPEHGRGVIEAESSIRFIMHYPTALKEIRLRELTYEDYCEIVLKVGQELKMKLDIPTAPKLKRALEALLNPSYLPPKVCQTRAISKEARERQESAANRLRAKLAARAEAKARAKEEKEKENKEASNGIENTTAQGLVVDEKSLLEEPEKKTKKKKKKKKKVKAIDLDKSTEASAIASEVLESESPELESEELGSPEGESTELTGSGASPAEEPILISETTSATETAEATECRSPVPVADLDKSAIEAISSPAILSESSGNSGDDEYSPELYEKSWESYEKAKREKKWVSATSKGVAKGKSLDTSSEETKPWTVTKTKEFQKKEDQIEKDDVLERLEDLISDLKKNGPMQRDWLNFGILDYNYKDIYHCHLVGSHKIVAFWTVDWSTRTIQLYRLGAHHY